MQLFWLSTGLLIVTYCKEINNNTASYFIRLSAHFHAGKANYVAQKTAFVLIEEEAAEVNLRQTRRPPGGKIGEDQDMSFLGSLLCVTSDLC